MSDGPTAMLRGSTVFRVVWLPGSDLLRGYCWCGESRTGEDPVELWAWLVDHPSTHAGGPDDEPGRGPETPLDAVPLDAGRLDAGRLDAVPLAAARG